MTIKGDIYRSQVDLVVSGDGGQTPVMVVKCCAGSPASREREVVSAARLLKNYQIPIAVVSDAKAAIVLDVVRGKKLEVVWRQFHPRPRLGHNGCIE